MQDMTVVQFYNATFVTISMGEGNLMLGLVFFDSATSTYSFKTLELI